MKESKAWVMAAFALLGAHVSYGVRTINYEASSEHTIAIDAAAYNNDNYDDANPNSGGAQGYNLFCADGATIKLTKKAEGCAVYKFNSTVLAQSGTAPTVTLDLSGLAGAPFLMLGNLHFKDDATLHIAGTNVFTIGCSENWPSYYPTFNVPFKVTFDDGVAGKVVFAKDVCLWCKPADLTYEIAAGANLHLHDNALGFTGDALTLSDYDLALVDSTADANGKGASGKTHSVPANMTITVPTGRTLTLFPCSIDANWRWNRQLGVISNNVVLAGGTLACKAQGGTGFRLAGALSGTGTLKPTWTFSAYAGSETLVSGPVDVSDLVLTYVGTKDFNLHLFDVRAGSSFASVTWGANQSKNTALKLEGSYFDDYAAHPVTIASISDPNSLGANATLSASDPLVVSVGGTLPTATKIAGTGKVRFNAVGANVTLASGTEMSCDSARVMAYGDSWYVYGANAAVPSALNLTASPATRGMAFTVKNGETLDVVGGEPRNEVHVAAGGTLDVAMDDSRMGVVVEGGTVNVWDTGLSPLVWLDASATNSITDLSIAAGTIWQAETTTLLAAQDVKLSSGDPLINTWHDCRAGKNDAHNKYKAWSDRYDLLFATSYHPLFPHTHPARVRGGLNGRDYVSFSKSYPVLSCTVTLADGGEKTYKDDFNMVRMFFRAADATQPKGSGDAFKPRFAILVFGSQSGGGQALLAGDASFGRGAADAAAPITTNTAYGVEAWVDGVKVDVNAQNTLNGDWQIVSLDLKGKVNVCGLGYCDNTSFSNQGQRYAEVMLFDVELTDDQRSRIERRLAAKWGLTYKGETDDASTSAVTLYGTSGTVVLQENTTLAGGYSGAIALNGKTLTIEGSLPPAEDAISTQGLTGWYDPEDAATVVEQNVAARTPQRRVSRIYDKRGCVNGLRMLDGWTDSRYPWLDVAAHGLGPVRHWIDYSESVVSSGNTGCTLRYITVDTAKPSQRADTVAHNPFRTLVMVQDSARSGGMPFVDGGNVLASGSHVYAPRGPSHGVYASKGEDLPAATDPIYPSGTGAALAGGQTYLDGVRVADPTTTGFLGRPEILTVIPNATDYKIVAHEWLYNNEHLDAATTRGAIQGEIITYDRMLDDAERAKVESYLAWKWLGKTGAGYSALTNATISGTGSVVASSFATLPKFAADCTAAVSVDAETLDFVYADGGVSGVRDLGQAAVSFPAAMTVNLTCAEKPMPGSHTLVSCGSGLTKTTFTLNATGTTGSRVFTLRRTDTALVLDVTMSGMFILYR